MSYNISQAKTDLQGRLHGTSLNKIQGVNDLMSRAGRQLLLDLDPQETKRTAELTNALYDGVYDYAAPDDLKGNKVIDIRPQVDRTEADNFSQTWSEEFDMYKAQLATGKFAFNVRHNSGVKTVRIAKNTIAGQLLHDMNSITDNGTWVVSGAGSNLQEDSTYHVSGGYSLSFDVTGNSISYLTNSTFTAIDLSTAPSQRAVFVWVYIPTSTYVSSIALRWGSDSSNYYEKSITATHTASAFQNGWNLLRFDGGSETGTVVDTGIDYLRLAVTHTASMSGIRVDNIISNLPSIYEIEYYSKYLFRTAAGVWQETVDSDTNLVNLDTESYNLFLDLCEIFAIRQMNDPSVLEDLKNSEKMYSHNLMRYKGQYRSEAIKTINKYYRMPKPAGIGRRWI